jgi:hypothetical protein
MLFNAVGVASGCAPHPVGDRLHGAAMTDTIAIFALTIVLACAAWFSRRMPVRS